MVVLPWYPSQVLAIHCLTRYYVHGIPTYCKLIARKSGERKRETWSVFFLDRLRLRPLSWISTKLILFIYPRIYVRWFQRMLLKIFFTVLLSRYFEGKLIDVGNINSILYYILLFYSFSTFSIVSVYFIIISVFISYIYLQKVYTKPKNCCSMWTL